LKADSYFQQITQIREGRKKRIEISDKNVAPQYAIKNMVSI